MARLFISCNHRDYDLGKKIENALIAHGHKMTIKVNPNPAGRWEPKFLHGLHEADAFICLLTQNGLDSDWVLAQTGMAISRECTRNLLVLPVVPAAPKGQWVPYPSLVQAFHCFTLRGPGPSSISKLAKDLHEAITAHQATRPPRIFISHRHHDRTVASRLIELLDCAFKLRKRDIRCTSVPGYKLSVGSQSADSLQADLMGAEIVMGLVGPDTAESDYVLFELGAAWGLRTPTFPLRIKGASFKHIPEVLREKSSLALQELDHCIQLVEDVARVPGFERKQVATRRIEGEARRLASAAKAPAKKSAGRSGKRKRASRARA